MISQPLRVLHVLNELKPSGAETMLLAAAPVFAEHGVKTEILTTGAQPGVFAERLAAVGYAISHIPFGRSLSSFRKIHALMRGGYDVIHLHTEQANFWFGLTARLAGVPVVLRTIHAAFNFEGGLRRKRGAQRRLLTATGVRHVAISPSVSENELNRFGLRTELIANWYDSTRFKRCSSEERTEARRHFGIDADEKVIVSVGNCSPIKNHSALIQALALISEECRPLYLHVGIEDPDQSERRLANDLGVVDRIRFVGPLSDVRPALHAADFFVMPSLYEGFGIAAIEALATGLPSIFSDVSGLRDFRQHFPGLRYSATDAVALAAAIKEGFSLSPAERTVNADEYPAIAERLYGMQRGVSQYMTLYLGGEKKA